MSSEGYMRDGRIGSGWKSLGGAMLREPSVLINSSDKVCTLHRYENIARERTLLESKFQGL